MNKNDLQALIDELTDASEIYYQKLGESPLDDEEFDAKLEFLKSESLTPAHQAMFAAGTQGFLLLEGDPGLGTKSSSRDVVAHGNPMLSLGKAKTRVEMENFIRKMRLQGAQDFKLQAKLDGLAMSAQYTDGKLTLLSTRGDGLEGDNISYLSSSSKMTLEGLATIIPLKGNAEVRGELFLSHGQFADANQQRKALTGEEFKNSRNALVGIVKKAKLGLDYPVQLTFAAYSLFIDGTYTSLTELKGVINTVDDSTKGQGNSLKLEGFADDEEFFQSLDQFGVARSNFTIPTDGVVVKPVNETEMMTKLGSTSHHPISQIAFKYPGATATTSIIGITVTVGKTGKLTPVAKVAPVDLMGTVIQNISLHNYNLVAEMDLRIGSIVDIHRANDVIPQAKRLISNPEASVKVVVPTHCPECNSTLMSEDDSSVWPPKTLRCTSFTCPSRIYFILKTAVGKNYLDINGMSEKTLDFFYKAGRIKTIDDFYTLTLDELATSQFGESGKGGVRVLGPKRAQKILDYIERSKTLPTYRIISSLGIQGLGARMSKDILPHYVSMEALHQATVTELSNIDGIGQVRAEFIVDGLQRTKTILDNLQSAGVKMESHWKQDSPTPRVGKLAGLNFAISGEAPGPFKSRGDFVSYLENHGATLQSSPRESTNYIIGDSSSTSSKTVKALKLGIEFISPDEFATKFEVTV
jgi:DNA ligase (NAD+)